MNKETAKAKKNLLVLVPHRDARLEAQKYSETLKLAEGYIFPCAAPLASVSKPLTENELKKTAKSLRKVLGTQMMHASETAAAEFQLPDEKMSLFGLCLNIKIPHEAFDNIYKNILNLLSPVVIGAFLFPEKEKNRIQDVISKINADNPPKIFFRAAAIANMYWQPFVTEDETAFKWKIGKLCWLPGKARF